MKKGIVLLMGAALLLSGCGSYTANGALIGSDIGHVIGASIGGINGGWRGHHVGSLIGTVGGAVAGAAIGAAVENAQQRKMAEAESRRMVPPQRQSGISRHDRTDDYDAQMQADDRIEFDNTDGFEGLEGAVPRLEIRNAHIIDASHNGILTRGEECTVVFEVMNNTGSTIYDVYPFVEDATSNKHIKVSPNLRVEHIPPFHGIRYTATIMADKRLKDGQLVVLVGVREGMRALESQTRQFKIPTRKKSEK
jgi:uncharacterized protein YcfJ